MTGCDVCLYPAEDIDNVFFASSEPRARKPHTCCECRGVIQPGSRYLRESGKSDGEMFVYVTCLLCAEIRNEFYCGGAYYIGTLWEELENQAFDHLTTASECFRELTPAAKAMVLERWARWKGIA